jgi:hypothetical protein
MALMPPNHTVTCSVVPNCLFCAVCLFGEYINLSPDSSAVVAKADGWGVEIRQHAVKSRSVRTGTVLRVVLRLQITAV